MEIRGTQVAEGYGVRVYWKESPGRKSVDSNKLKKLYPEIWAECLKVGKSYKSFRAYFLKNQVIE